MRHFWRFLEDQDRGLMSAHGDDDLRSRLLMEVHLAPRGEAPVIQAIIALNRRYLGKIS